MKDELWYKDAVFYQVYVRAFFDSNADGHGDLAGLTQKLDYLKDLGVDCLWLMPIYPSPLKDDGYDISDFYGIYPTYGDVKDFKALLDAAHKRGMRVITDLVLNHTSDQHPWFQAARSDPNSPYRDYYVWSDTDQKYKEARIIFLDVEKSNWTWDEAAGQYYWHRFYSSQPDLNYDNPAVQEEMINVMKFWLDMGIDGFRCDAVPYLFEREGTNCENLPLTHEYLKRLRRFMDEHYPGRIMLAEANQWPQDVIQYFGSGRDEFHMGFHFPLMPRIFMALKREEREPLVWILDQTPDLSEYTQWCIFLRNHDELTLEMVTEEERQWMWEQYAPEPRMRLNLGIRRRLAPLLDNDRGKLGLAYSLLFTMPGSPIIYYGDEIGMGDNIWLKDRDGVRTPMQWSNTNNAGFSDADAEKLYAPVIEGPVYGPERVNVADQINDPDSLLNMVRHMISVRKQYPVFGWGKFTWVFGEAPYDSSAVCAYLRHHENERVLVVHNFSGSSQSVVLRPPIEIQAAVPVDLLTGKTYTPFEDNRLKLDLAPYQYLWLRL
ncbi:MAG: maltose alpha-D-glucosyltransferase [Chloroflexi bacterium]|jgi:maltose alpha-D-glucosyltransferase/alpha-amylase|nr:maltose alpha-D-glucosyltransferase [Chloroflexota bacterium]